MLARRMYKKNRVIVEALQLSWNNWSAICDFVKAPYSAYGVFLDENDEILSDGHTSSRIGLLLTNWDDNITTSSTIAIDGDWIIKNEKGEFFRCQPAIFTELYEIISEAI